MGPLDGVRVLEVASFVSGPFVGQMLADLGAEVVKVEPPRGDPFRRFSRPAGAYSPLFANCNRGKRSLTLDLREPSQREHLLQLITEVDVWISNWRPGVAARLDLDDDVLAGVNPRLIRLYVTGYGAAGPRAAAPVFDTIVQATSGLTDALAHDDRPVVVPGFPVDKLTAALAAQSVLAALFARERGGAGDRIDVSMLAAAAYMNFVELFANRTFLDVQPASARNLQATGLRALRAQDGWLTIAPVSGPAVKEMCEVVGHPEWVDELRRLPDQTQLAAALFARLEPLLADRTVGEWLELLCSRDVPAARCLTMDEHLADQQTIEEDIYRVTEWEGVGRVRTVRYPARFGSAPDWLGAGGPAPLLEGPS